MANWFNSSRNESPSPSPMAIAQLMLEQRTMLHQRRSASLSTLSSSLAAVGNPSARPMFPTLMAMRQSPLQPSNRISSSLVNETMLMLNNRAQQSRFPDLAYMANTSLALELARKKKMEYQQLQTHRPQYPQVLPRQSLHTQLSNLVVDPSDVDVLLGRGGRSNHHVGNTRYRELIRNNRAEYISLPKHEKIKLSRAIVAVVHDLGGRFLELADDGKHYVVAANARAVEKTSQCLREKRADGNQKSLSATAIKTANLVRSTETDSQPTGVIPKAA